MKKFIYILLFICGLVACSKTSVKYSRYADFPKEKTLYGESISLDTALFRYPFRITIKDNIAIVMDLHNAEHFLHAFTLPDWKHLVSFGKRGEAPDEIISATAFRFESLDSIWVLDANKVQITRWTVSPIKQIAEQIETISLDKNLARTLDFSPMNPHFLVPDYLGKYRFHRINNQGECLTSEHSIPTETDYQDIALPALAQAWRSFMDYNPNNQILAFATQLGEVLEIYNIKDSTQAIIYGSHGEPKFKIAENDGIPTGIMGFSDIQITDKYIYTVFHGRRFKDIISAHQRGEIPEDGGRYIYVFDLKGNPICKYTLDHAIYGIDVHEEEGIIYATDVNHDEPIIKLNI